jgi:hypothetical protein
MAIEVLSFIINAGTNAFAMIPVEKKIFVKEKNCLQMQGCQIVYFQTKNFHFG